MYLYASQILKSQDAVDVSLLQILLWNKTRFVMSRQPAFQKQLCP